MSAEYPTSSSAPAEEQKDWKETAQEMASQVGETAGHWREQAEETWRGAREGLQEGWSSLSDRAGDFWGDVTGLVRRYPVASVAIAFGLGCLAACAWNMMPRSDDMTDRMSHASS